MHTLLEENLMMARKLINRGANINYVNGNGQTALHICVMHNTMKSIEWLLKQKKIDRHISDLEGNDPCDLAKRDPSLLDHFHEFSNCNPRMKHSASGTQFIEHMRRTFNEEEVGQSHESLSLDKSKSIKKKESKVHSPKKPTKKINFDSSHDVAPHQQHTSHSTDDKAKAMVDQQLTIKHIDELKKLHKAIDNIQKEKQTQVDQILAEKNK